MAHTTMTRTMLEEEVCPPLSCRASSLMAFLLRFAAGGLAGGGGLLLAFLFPFGLHVESRIYGSNQQVGDETNDQNTDHDEQGEGVKIRPGAPGGNLVVGDGVDDQRSRDSGGRPSRQEPPVYGPHLRDTE